MKIENQREDFYTCDPAYKHLNGMAFQVEKLLTEEPCTPDNRLYGIRFQDGTRLHAFEDELNGFIREHEDDPIELPVRWEVSAPVAVKQPTIQQAIDYFESHKDDYGVPPQDAYVEDSFGLVTADSDKIAEGNAPFLSWSQRDRKLPKET